MITRRHDRNQAMTTARTVSGDLACPCSTQGSYTLARVTRSG